MINKTKENLRKLALKLRQENAVQNPIISKRITAKILSSDDFIKSKNIALYMPIKGEIDLTALFKVKNKNYYLPRCCSDNNLEFIKFVDYKNLVKGSFGIPEPKGNPVNPDIIDIIFIPALMANTSCYRLGWGKGYYDNFLNTHKLKCKKTIIIANNCITDDFKEDICDYRCDSILSEK